MKSWYHCIIRKFTFDYSIDSCVPTNLPNSSEQAECNTRLILSEVSNSGSFFTETGFQTYIKEFSVPNIYYSWMGNCWMHIFIKGIVSDKLQLVSFRISEGVEYADCISADGLDSHHQRDFWI